jgi:hypothetical protein
VLDGVELVIVVRVEDELDKLVVIVLDPSVSIINSVPIK